MESILWLSSQTDDGIDFFDSILMDPTASTNINGLSVGSDWVAIARSDYKGTYGQLNRDAILAAFQKMQLG